jgi:hypothetical protein
MQVPNWKHHSRKEQKRKLKPQALRQAKARLAQFKKRHTGRPKGDLSFYDRFIRNEIQCPFATKSNLNLQNCLLLKTL